MTTDAVITDPLAIQKIIHRNNLDSVRKPTRDERCAIMSANGTIKAKIALINFLTIARANVLLDASDWKVAMMQLYGVAYFDINGYQEHQTFRPRIITKSRKAQK